MILLSSLSQELTKDCTILNDGFFKYTSSAIAKSLSNVICYAVNEKYLNRALNNDNVTCVIVPETLKEKVKLSNLDKGILLSPNPELSYREINNYFYQKGLLKLDYSFFISSKVIIGKGTNVGEHVFIGDNVVIGENCIIYDNTIIHEGCVIEDNVTIGNEGLYFKRDADGVLHRIYSSGGVIIQKHVEILNGSTVQRSHDLGQLTTIGEGTKISVNVNVGHSAEIGMHTLISGNVQIAGRAKIGSYCWIGTSSTISDSVEIGDFAKVRIGSVVVQNVKKNGDVSGNFAYLHRARLKNHQKLRKGF